LIPWLVLILIQSSTTSAPPSGRSKTCCVRPLRGLPCLGPCVGALPHAAHEAVEVYAAECARGDHGRGPPYNPLAGRPDAELARRATHPCSSALRSPTARPTPCARRPLACCCMCSGSTNAASRADVQRPRWSSSPPQPAGLPLPVSPPSGGHRTSTSSSLTCKMFSGSVVIRLIPYVIHHGFVSFAEFQ